MSNTTHSLTFIGTVHLDPAESGKLTDALDNLGPAVITIEISGHAIDFRELRGPELLKRLDQRKLGVNAHR